MKILTVLDLITNSSSESFVIRRRKNANDEKDIINILQSVFNELGLDINDYLDWKTESKSKGEDPWYGIKTKRGDLIILNDEGRHKPLPSAISCLIEEFDSLDPSIESVQSRRG